MTCRLVPCHPELLVTLIETPEAFEQAAGFPAAPGLREMFAGGDTSPAWLEALRVSRAPDPWRHGFFVVDGEARAAIGMAAFKGPADPDGTVEIAYGIAPGFQGRGHATAAAAALVAFAFAAPEVKLVRAHTLPVANASTRVLARCGFGRVGDVVDPDDGPVWRWERGR